jgi:hypothetical protein
MPKSPNTISFSCFQNLICTLINISDSRETILLNVLLPEQSENKYLTPRKRHMLGNFIRFLNDFVLDLCYKRKHYNLQKIEIVSAEITEK